MNPTSSSDTFGSLGIPQDVPPVGGLGGPVLGEQTAIQAVITSPWVMRFAAMPATYATYRELRKDPTVALARMVAVAPILASNWSYRSEDGIPDSWVRFLKRQMDRVRTTYLENVLFYGNIDFGYQGFEQVLGYDRDGRIELQKLKPLLQDITEIVIGQHGEFLGYQQPGVRLAAANVLHVAFRVEGSYLYGVPLLENVRKACLAWQEADEGARRYDRKIAGATVVVHYPKGSSYDERGVLTPNPELAKRLAHKLESSGAVAIPRDVAQLLETAGLDSPGWKIELLSDGGSLQAGFTGRLEYLDKLKVRGILVPERTVLEGQHGTLAEAEAHADVALTQADLTHRYVVDQLNAQVVDPLLVLNFGQHARGAVQVVPAPIVDAKRGFFRDLYKTLLSNPNFQAHELSALDLDALKDTLGLPKSTEIDARGKQPVSPSLQNPGAIACDGSDDDEGHWVTINGNHVLIQGPAPDRRKETIRLLADAKYGGDMDKAKEDYEKYVRDLAFLIKNPMLGSNPGAENAKMRPFSDKLTQADLDKAEEDAQKFLASYLRGERADHPGQFRGNGVFNELRELEKMRASGAVMTPAQRTAYEDLKRWSDVWYSCYQRAVHGMTKLEQFGGMIGRGVHHDLIGALGGFAGVGIGGKSIRPEPGENVWGQERQSGQSAAFPEPKLPEPNRPPTQAESSAINAMDVVKGRFARVNPAGIAFSQRTAGGKGRAASLRENMANGWNGPAVDVVETPNGLVAIDNTRISLAQELGMPEVPVKIRLPSDPLPASMLGRFGVTVHGGKGG